MTTQTGAKAPKQRDEISLYIADLSSFTKALRSELAKVEGLPGHLEMMGVVARAAGKRNYQSLRAEAEASPLPEPDRRALMVFTKGRMRRWPKLRGVQALCLWPLWDRLPPRREMTEPEVNAAITEGHNFGDHALLRRSLVSAGLLWRTNDGAVYRRVEQRPPDAALALIRAVKAQA
ncbi:hypothetical protein PSA7680_01169 [Pseudoruegeria aquimaris]|uniref:DUF2087 domain-containing protein n=1 Tax=Pseudoruegeria aquimaris TaxID=393663 RepID=A0A1Y5RWE9_9RHOB|nr:DUF2087 domain-containing protein [Pseudoruegeria aquimaris]SLN26639.1 hypothetical protein PSA7680_01169 [Pseudoruegeria aquimaris]